MEKAMPLPFFKDKRKETTRPKAVPARRNGYQRRHVPADRMTLEYCFKLQRAYRKARNKHARLILDQWSAYLASLPIHDE